MRDGVRRDGGWWSVAHRSHVCDGATRTLSPLQARIMDAIADNIERVWGDRVAVPRSVNGMVSQDVLVMTLLPGDTLLDGLTRSDGHGIRT